MDSYEELFQRLKNLDPEVQENDYKYTASEQEVWDVDALQRDLKLTETYCADALEEALVPLREELLHLLDKNGPAADVIEVVPGMLFLGNKSLALDLQKLQSFGFKQVINCAPQSVASGADLYGDMLTNYIELWQDDYSDFCVMQDFDAVWESLQNPDHCPCLIHCEQGVNRSAALAIAVHMRHRYLLHNEAAMDAVASLRFSWQGVAQQKGQVLLNTGFQRQLLLFARLGMQWFPTCKAVWRTVQERRVARFRRLAQQTIRQLISGQGPFETRWRELVRIRDRCIRGEAKFEDAFNMDSMENYAKLKRRIETFAKRSLSGLRKEQERVAAAAARANGTSVASPTPAAVGAEATGPSSRRPRTSSAAAAGSGSRNDDDSGRASQQLEGSGVQEEMGRRGTRPQAEDGQGHASISSASTMRVTCDWLPEDHGFSQSEEYLHLLKGEYVEMRPGLVDGWAYGIKKGSGDERSGWFPPTYVQEVGSESNQHPAQVHEGTSGAALQHKRQELSHMEDVIEASRLRAVKKAKLTSEEATKQQTEPKAAERAAKEKAAQSSGKAGASDCQQHPQAHKSKKRKRKKKDKGQLLNKMQLNEVKRAKDKLNPGASREGGGNATE